jgi:hypothetical protein
MTHRQTFVRRLVVAGGLSILWALAGTASAQTSCQTQCGLTAQSCHAGCSTNQPCHANCEAAYQNCLRACQPQPTAPPPTPTPCKPAWKVVAAQKTGVFARNDAISCTERESYYVKWHDSNNCFADGVSCELVDIHTHAPGNCCLDVYCYGYKCQ